MLPILASKAGGGATGLLIFAFVKCDEAGEPAKGEVGGREETVAEAREYDTVLIHVEP